MTVHLFSPARVKLLYTPIRLNSLSMYAVSTFYLPNWCRQNIVCYSWQRRGTFLWSTSPCIFNPEASRSSISILTW